MILGRLSRGVSKIRVQNKEKITLRCWARYLRFLGIMNHMKYIPPFPFTVLLPQNTLYGICRGAIHGCSLVAFPCVCFFLGVQVGFIAMTSLKCGLLRTVFGRMLPEKTLLYTTNLIVIVSYCLTSVTDCL